MNAHEMLDYAVGQLDGPARDAADRELAADPETARTVERLTRAVHLLLDDGESYPPPPGLARRTSAFVAEAARGRRRTILEFVPIAVPFRPADIAVAAAVFVAGVLTLLPAVRRSKDRMEQAGCTYNLSQLGQALWQYGSRHHHYPFGPYHNPKAPAGAYVALLSDNGLLSGTDLNTLDCPCNGLQRGDCPLPNFDTVCALQSSDPKKCREALCSDYAYNVGYLHPSGRVGPVSADHSATVPLLADQPPHEEFRTLLEGNSPNHHGRGQNVLYTDLHVGWHPTRRLTPKDDDMFLNARHELAPGLNAEDAALLPSLAPSLGR